MLVGYVSFIISEDGIMADPDKVKVMKQMPPPTCVREVRSFIAMFSYYRRFIPNFSAIVKPLIQLTKKMLSLSSNAIKADLSLPTKKCLLVMYHS